MQFLRRQPPVTDAPRPDVIVLDLNLPVMNGHEVLTAMASDPVLSTIPVAILTTSTSETYVCDVCPRGRCLYFTKTADFKMLQDFVRQIAAHAKTAPNRERSASQFARLRYSAEKASLGGLRKAGCIFSF